MDWGQHISEISSTATMTLGFHRRDLAFAPQSSCTTEVAYKTLVRPNLEPLHKTSDLSGRESSEDSGPLYLQEMAKGK